MNRLTIETKIAVAFMIPVTLILVVILMAYMQFKQFSGMVRENHAMILDLTSRPAAPEMAAKEIAATIRDFDETLSMVLRRMLMVLVVLGLMATVLLTMMGVLLGRSLKAFVVSDKSDGIVEDAARRKHLLEFLSAVVDDYVEKSGKNRSMVVRDIATHLDRQR